MSSLIEEVRTGVNDQFRDIRREDKNKNQKRRITVCSFSSPGEFTYIRKNERARDIRNLRKGEYSASGLTALRDAVGDAITDMQKLVDKDVHVLVHIMTDGHENASREWTWKAVSKLIDTCRSNGWAITFLGSSEDLLSDASSMNVSAGSTFTFSPTVDGYNTAFTNMSMARNRHTLAVMNCDLVQLDNLYQQEDVKKPTRTTASK